VKVSFGNGGITMNSVSRRIRARALALILATTALLLPIPAAVARDAPLENPSRIPIAWTGAGAPSLEAVQRAIISGCSVRGWSCQAIKPGQIRAVLHVRRHMAESLIAFDTKEYSITYVDSRELRYNAEKNEIHRKYNLWVTNLIADINKAIAALR
jgi:hypothetical protein